MKVFTIKEMVENPVAGYTLSETMPFDLELLFAKIYPEGVKVDIYINGESISYNRGFDSNALNKPNNRVSLASLKAGDKIEIEFKENLSTCNLLALTLYGEEVC